MWGATWTASCNAVTPRPPGRGMWDLFHAARARTPSAGLRQRPLRHSRTSVSVHAAVCCSSREKKVCERRLVATRDCKHAHGFLLRPRALQAFPLQRNRKVEGGTPRSTI